MRTVFRGACIVSMDPSIGDLLQGDILIEDNMIAAVGPAIDAADAEVINAAGCIAVPGFVDAHRHFWEGAVRSVTADWSILDFVGNIRLLAAGFFRPEDMYATSYLGALEAINAGVTTVAEYCHNARTTAHARQSIAGVRASRIRSVWCYSFTGLAPSDEQRGGSGGELAFVEALAAEEFAGRGRLTFGVCPEEPMHWKDDAQAVRQQFALARKLGVRTFMHVNSVRQPDGSLAREVERLHAIGALGPDLTLVHMGYTADDEWPLLGRTGTHVVYTPETEMQMGLGWPNVAPARQAGVNIGIGTDITANNSADMFFQLRTALQVERARAMTQPGRQYQARTPLDCRDALYWGTMGGAAACGLADRIGSLTPGKEADVVLLRADDISMAGWDRRNPAASVVLQAGVHSVDTVMVGGTILKQGGRLAGDARGAVAALEATSAYIHGRADAAGGFGASQEVLYQRLAAGGLL